MRVGISSALLAIALLGGCEPSRKTASSAPASKPAASSARPPLDDPGAKLLVRRAPRCENPTLDSFNHYFAEDLFPWFEENESEARDLVDALAPREAEATPENSQARLVATRALLHVVREWIDAGLACNPAEFVTDPSRRRKVDATLYFRTWEDRERARSLVEGCLASATEGSPEREECSRFDAELLSWSEKEKKNAGSK